MKTRHHVVPKSRGGHNGHDNIILLEDEKHRLYHALFGNKTVDEAMAYLYYNFTTPEWRARHREIEG